MSIWSEAKGAFHALLATDDPRFSETRGRLERHRPSSTYTLISAIAFWLSGAINVPLSAATPIACVLLYFVHQSSVGALLDSEEEEAATEGAD